MTEPTLYVTEGEIVRRMGVGIHAGRKAVQKMRLHPKFPPKDIGGKRYWPAVKAFLDFWNNLSIDAPGNQAGQEQNNAKTKYNGRARPSLAAAKEWLGGRVDMSPGHRHGSQVQADIASDRRVRERTD
jgi:hypothetical protein